MNLTQGYDESFYKIPIEESMSEKELKPLAESLKALLKFDLLIDKSLDNYRNNALDGLTLLRQLYPPELLRECVKYLEDKEKIKLKEFVIQLNNIGNKML
jgi:hypothetical protein